MYTPRESDAAVGLVPKGFLEEAEEASTAWDHD
jgi:hypothetical protein